MTILDRIILAKRKEVALKMLAVPYTQLEQSELFKAETLSLCRSLQASSSGIIAEFKRRSPSKGIINNNEIPIQDVVKGYDEAGVCGISVLTDMNFFGGAIDDLLLARASVKIPILRKEFIIDEYQIVEAKSAGADVILLIAAVLTKIEIITLSQFAKSLQLEVLIEIHNREQLEKSMNPSIHLIGVNNRNLKTFEVNTDISKELANCIPNDFLKISESGIDSPETVKELRNYGYSGFLIGETFMKTNNPGTAAAEFIAQLKP